MTDGLIGVTEGEIILFPFGFKGTNGVASGLNLNLAVRVFPVAWNETLVVEGVAPRAGVEAVVECDELTELFTVAAGEFALVVTTWAFGEGELVVAVWEKAETVVELTKNGVDKLLPDVSVVGKVDLTVAANDEELFWYLYFTVAGAELVKFLTATTVVCVVTLGKVTTWVGAAWWQLVLLLKILTCVGGGWDVFATTFGFWAAILFVFVKVVVVATYVAALFVVLDLTEKFCVLDCADPSRWKSFLRL